MVDVNKKFKSKTETLFHCCAILDKYISGKTIEKEKLQLVGVAAMFIASKYVEIYPPLLNDFVYICDFTYSLNDIKLMEKDIILALDFHLSFTTSNAFLHQFLYQIGQKSPSKFQSLCEYLLQKTLLNHELSS